MIRKYAEIFCWKNVSSFCSAKATHIFSAKNIRILYIESTKIVNEMTLNKLVKLTKLWTTGSWCHYNVIRCNIMSCFGCDISVRKHSKSEHWTPCYIQTHCVMTERLLVLLNTNKPNIFAPLHVRSSSLVNSKGSDEITWIITHHSLTRIVLLQEGKQASMAADFSINQFSYIGRLLMVHGRDR